MSEYKSRLLLAIEQFDFGRLALLVDRLRVARELGHTVFLIGNGGSATTASHIANDWMLGTLLLSPPIRVLALTDNMAAITATGNDQEFSRVFSRQLEHLAGPSDVLIAISASGNSTNVLSAVKVGREIGMFVVGLSGFDGGTLAREVDMSFIVESSIGDYGVVEDVHLAIGHAVKEMLIENCA